MRDLLRTRLSIKSVKVLGRRLDDLLNLTGPHPNPGFAFQITRDTLKGHLGRLSRNSFLQAMRVALPRQIQLRITREQTQDPTLAVTGASDSNRPKDAMIAGCHAITLAGAHHTIGAAHRLPHSTRTLLIQMFLQQQSEQFAPIAFPIGFNVAMSLFAWFLGTQMAGDLDEFLIGTLKRRVKSERLCFHRRGPLVLGSV